MKHDYMYLTFKIACDFSVLHCDYSLPVCVQLFLREIQVPEEFLAAKEKRALRVIQDFQEYQVHRGSEEKLEVQESQVWGTLGGMESC